MCRLGSSGRPVTAAVKPAPSRPLGTPVSARKDISMLTRSSGCRQALGLTATSKLTETGVGLQMVISASVCQPRPCWWSSSLVLHLGSSVLHLGLSASAHPQHCTSALPASAHPQHCTSALPASALHLAFQPQLCTLPSILHLFQPQLCTLPSILHLGPFGLVSASAHVPYKVGLGLEALQNPAISDPPRRVRRPTRRRARRNYPHPNVHIFYPEVVPSLVLRLGVQRRLQFFNVS